MKSILRDISTAQDKETKSDSSQVQIESLEFLKLDNQTAIDDVTIATRLVLSHPLIKKYFLSIADDNQSNKKLFEVVTDFVSKLLLSATEHNRDITECLDFYLAKLEESLEGGNLQESVLGLLQVLTASCPDTNCGNLFGLLLQDKHQTDTSSELVAVLAIFMKKLMTSNIHQFNLSEQHFSNLFKACANPGFESKDIFVDFVGKFPILSVSCSEKCLNKLLTSDLDKSRLLPVLLSNNMTLTLSLIKKIEADELSPLHENLQLVHTCLKVTGASEYYKGMYQSIYSYTTI